MARILAGSVTIDGTDDENWPESDEEVHRVFAVEAVLDEGQPAQAFDIPDVRWGGECRVELRITARAVDNGTVQVEGQARLFEGDSEDSSDLEEEQTVTMTVPRGGRPAHLRVQLSNSGLGGGDHAEIGLSFTNSVLED